MAKPVLSLDQVLSTSAVFRLPRVIAFNRLEARPRTLDFTRSLRAEIRDPLWLLTRQWQFVGFEADLGLQVPGGERALDNPPRRFPG